MSNRPSAEKPKMMSEEEKKEPIEEILVSTGF